jgi:hypothetical protein
MDRRALLNLIRDGRPYTAIELLGGQSILPRDFLALTIQLQRDGVIECSNRYTLIRITGKGLD